MRVTGRVEEADGRFYVHTERGPRQVAPNANDAAAELVGQEVQGEFTQQGVVDLIAIGAVVDTLAAGVERPTAAAGDEFFNPYTFIPAPTRTTTAAELGDGDPCGHDRYRPERWAGRIRMTLTADSPLLMTDAGTAQWTAGGHGTFHTRQQNGKPIIPASSVKGMIRSAFEAVTVSRFGLFDAKHSHRLAFRQAANAALSLVPARVSSCGNHLELLAGTTTIGNNGRVPNGDPQYAAWLPAYHPHGFTLADLGLAPDEPLSPLKVQVRIRLASKPGPRGFTYWQVVDILQFEDTLPTQAHGPMVTPQDRLHTNAVSTGDWVGNTTQVVTGWLHWTNQNFGTKHDERVFFTTAAAPPQVNLTPALRATWDSVIASYREAHREKEITGRNGAINQPWLYLGNDPGDTAWSPHLYDHTRQELTPGSLCYATVTTGMGGLRVTSLRPVMIGRELFEASPAELAAAAHLTSATRFDELSAADRVFGWVNSSKGDDQAIRGHVRIGFVEADEASISEFAGGGIPLAILSSPKPTQARFYAAADPSGTPLAPRSAKQDGYTPGHGLRGRKVYPPHQVDDGHWNNPTDLDTPREFQHADGIRGDQNRSATSWVDPGSAFHFDMWIDNLTDVELGALLHVVEMPEHTSLRVGAGRPLGFGSVHLKVDWDHTDLIVPPEDQSDNDPTEVVTDPVVLRYRDLRRTPATVDNNIKTRLEHAFKAALIDLVGTEGASEVLTAYAVSIRGGEGPVHYPRARQQPDPDGNNYEWFTRNDRQEHHMVMAGRGLALPAPYGPLPYYPNR